MNPFKKPFKMDATEHEKKILNIHILIFFVFSFFCECQIFVSFCVCYLNEHHHHQAIVISVVPFSRSAVFVPSFDFGDRNDISLLHVGSLPYLHQFELESFLNGKAHTKKFAIRNKTKRLVIFIYTQFMTWAVFLRHAATGGSTKQNKNSLLHISIRE